MQWLMNTWYAVAWSDEVQAAPVGRTIVDQPMALFRREDGSISAIGGRCPHRFAPLARGKVVGDAIECPYHGLRFGTDGACMHNPHGAGQIPPNARVPSYQALERWGLVWVWPGAQPADAALLPDLSHLERADLGHVHGSMTMDAHYLLGVDNLIDLSHAQFVHGDRLRSSNFAAARITVEQHGDSVTNRLLIANSDVPPSFRAHMPEGMKVVDYWLDATWHLPNVVVNDVGITAPGRPREEGHRSMGVHIVTPASRHASHYFYAHSRNYMVGDVEADARIRDWQHVGFSIQDKPIIEGAARLMGDEVDPLMLHPVSLHPDAGPLRARRILARRIAEESQASDSTPGSSAAPPAACSSASERADTVPQQVMTRH